MTETPIVEEVHRIGEQLLAEHGGDLKALIQQMREQTEQAARAGRQVVTLSPRPAQPQSGAMRKVG
jgi:hypothetical protein